MDLRELLLQVIEQSDYVMLESLLEENHAVDIAEALEDFEDDSLQKFFSLLDNQTFASIIEQADQELQMRVIDFTETAKVVELFAYMDTDDITDILGEVSTGKKKSILERMRSSDSQELKMLLGYGEDTAGGLMTTQYIALRSSYNTGQALHKIKQIGPKTEIIETIYVVNRKNELLGTADLRHILAEPEDTLLEEIMDTNVISVYPDVDQEEVSLLVSKYDLKAIPVVNRRNALLGIITIDDIIDVIVEEQTEDFLKLSGVSADETYDSTVLTSLKRRLPWLFLNLLTASLAAFTVSRFQDVIAQVVILAVAMPVVAGLGGNAGAQTLSVIIRALALDEISLKEDWKYVFKQSVLGVLQGVAIGLVAGIVLALVTHNVYMGLIILLAMIINQLIASFFGFIIPLVLEQMGIDPAIASSIFLTALTDVIGFLAFLGLAKAFLPFII